MMNRVSAHLFSCSFVVKKTLVCWTCCASTFCSSGLIWSRSWGGSASSDSAHLRGTEDSWTRSQRSVWSRRNTQTWNWIWWFVSSQTQSLPVRRDGEPPRSGQEEKRHLSSSLWVQHGGGLFLKTWNNGTFVSCLRSLSLGEDEQVRSCVRFHAPVLRRAESWSVGLFPQEEPSSDGMQPSVCPLCEDEESLLRTKVQNLLVSLFHWTI